MHRLLVLQVHYVFESGVWLETYFLENELECSKLTYNFKWIIYSFVTGRYTSSYKSPTDAHSETAKLICHGSYLLSKNFPSSGFSPFFWICDLCVKVLCLGYSLSFLPYGGLNFSFLLFLYPFYLDEEVRSNRVKENVEYSR